MTTEYSIQKMVSDGTLSTIALGIQYLQRNDIYMRIAGEETPQSGAPSGYTWSFVNNTTLKILPVVPNGVEVVVYRRTDVDAMYNIYSQNAQFDEATIDENNQQLLYIAQEYLEQGIPGAGVKSVDYVSQDGYNVYYRITLTDGSYTDTFAIPKTPLEDLVRVPWTFATGGTVYYPTEAVLNEADGNYYSWLGTYPSGGYVVAPSTDPTAVVGYVPRTDVLLRGELAGNSGASLVGFHNPTDPEQPAQTTMELYAKRLAASINLAFRDISNFGYTEGMSNALPAIQAAIDSLPARGGVVLLPPHQINIIPIAGKMIEVGDGDGATTFSTKNGIKLMGAGAGFGVSGALVPTILNYNDTPTVTTPMIASNGRISDCAIKGVFLSLNGKCGGISINSTSGSDYDSLKIINPASNAIALSVIGGLAPTGNYNIFNRFSKISIALLSPNSVGLYMDGDFAAQNDTWITHFELMRIENFAGATGSTLAWFKFVDSCTFRRCHFDNKPEPTSNGVIFDATSNDGFPAGMAFYDCSVHQTAVLEDASHKIRKNYFYGNGTYDNEITPTHPLLCGITDTGNVFGEFLYGYPWKSVAATVTAGAGTITTVAGAVQYQKLGTTVNIRGTVFITTNGTGGGFIRVQLPAEVPVANENCFFIGRNTATGGALLGQMAAGSNTIFIRKFDDTYPGANGAQLEFSGTYMLAKV